MAPSNATLAATPSIADWPIATFIVAVVAVLNVETPTATFLAPDVSASPESVPIRIFCTAVVNAVPADEQHLHRGGHPRTE